MLKRFVFLVTALSVCLLTGCWNYRGLNELTIVSAMAIDQDFMTGEYKIAYQVVDVNGPVKTQGLRSKYVESTGKTFFDAARNAKSRLSNKLFFGNMQMVILSKEIAEKQDIGGIIDWMIRDAELRETLHVVISREDTAAKILKTDGIDKLITGYGMHEILMKDSSVTLSTVDIMLTQLFNVLNSKGISLVLPAIKNVVNDGSTTIEMCGAGVFSSERLVGFLTAEETKTFCFVNNLVKGGLITFPSQGRGKDDSVVEIESSSTGRSYSVNDNAVTFEITTETKGFLGETEQEIDTLEPSVVAHLEQMAAKTLEKRITDLIEKMKKDMKTDIFGFGNQIYKADPGWWQELGDQWPEFFSKMKVDVRCRIHFENTALLKQS